jgi:hypothetical protein
MVRLLGKTAIEVRDDYQVTLLVLASMSLKPKPGQTPSVAEAVSAMSADDRMSRVVAGITRLCEPFPRHWRGCHWRSSLLQTKRRGSGYSKSWIKSWIGSVSFGRCTRRSPTPILPRRPSGWHLRPARKGTGEDLPPMAPSRPELDQTTDPPAR